MPKIQRPVRATLRVSADARGPEASSVRTSWASCTGALDDLKIFGNAMTISFQMSEKLSGWLSSNLRSLTLLLKCCQYPISRATGLNSAFVQDKQAIGHTDNSWAVTN